MICLGKAPLERGFFYHYMMKWGSQHDRVICNLDNGRDEGANSVTSKEFEAGWRNKNLNENEHGS
jgi:hypothetical protein